MTEDALPSEALAGTARGAVVWGASFTIFRDVLQFAGMIVLVRLLAPQDYGRFAMAQSIVVLLSFLGSKSFVPHALQVRDTGAIPWQLHFTASCILNGGLFLLTLAVAAALWATPKLHDAAAPLAAMSFVHLVEIPAGISTARLRVAHQWRRFGTLVTLGAFAGLAAAILIALAGGRFWALVAPVLIMGVPLSLNLFLAERWRPDWSWHPSGYRHIFHFGLTRMGGALLLSGRGTAEQAMLAASFNLATLGIFTRSVGLATLLAGRIGTEVSATLLPVLTRADEGSDRFQRLAGLVLESIAWLSIPSAAFLMLAARDTVALLYGPKWAAVAPLIPFAAASVALSGLAAGAYNLLLANNRPRACLALDVASAVGAIALIFWLVPQGMSVYLTGLALMNAAVLLATVVVLRASGGIRLRSLGSSLVPPVLASTCAALVIFGVRSSVEPAHAVVIRLLIESIIFASIYLLVLRFAFAAALRRLLEVAPGGGKLSQLLFVRSPT